MLYLFPHALPYLLTLNKVVCHFRATGVTWWIPFKFNEDELSITSTGPCGGLGVSVELFDILNVSV